MNNSVKLYVDLETLQLIEGPGFRNPVSSLRFKRGDAAQIEVMFLAGGISPVAIGDPISLEIQFGIKPRNRYDIGYLVHSATWIMPDAEHPVYRCSPSFNTIELDSALGVGSSTGSELAEITLMGEITWRTGTGEPTSTRTFLVVVENDVNRGTEGVPTSAEPPYPVVVSLITTGNLAQRAIVFDAVQSLTNEQKAQARLNIGALGEIADGSLTIAKTAGLQTQLNAKAPASHTHTIQQITSLSTVLEQIGNQKLSYVINTPYELLSPSDLASTTLFEYQGSVWLNMPNADPIFLGAYDPPPPPQITNVYLDSWEGWTSFGAVEAGKNYHVRFDNFTVVPYPDYFGISYVNYGNASFSNIQLMSEGCISSVISPSADFSAILTSSPINDISEIFAEFTFTADSSFDWAGYSNFGYFGSPYYVGFTVTLTEIQ